MAWLPLIRIILAIISAVFGIAGTVNSYQANSNMMAGAEVGWLDFLYSIGPFAGAVISAAAAWLAPSWLPKGVDAKEVSEAITAIVAWLPDRGNAKKLRAAAFESVDVLVEIVGQNDPEILETLKKLSTQLHERFGMLNQVSSAVQVSDFAGTSVSSVATTSGKVRR
jgi:hypothetical protein